MKRGSRKGNNGYIGVDQSVVPNTGVVTPNKTYNIGIRELPYYQFGNTANAFAVPGSNYQRPTEWPALPSVTAGSQQIAALFAVYNNESNVCGLQINGAYTVNWGDGTSGSYTSGTVAIKRYDQASYAGLTSTVFRNYKPALITVTPQSGQTFTSINFSPAVTSGVTGVTGFAALSSTNWLDIRMAGSQIDTLVVSGWSGNARSSKLLEQFEFVGDAALTSFIFIDCQSLRKIISFPSTAKVTDWQSKFYGCRALQEIPRSALDGLVVGAATVQAPYTFYQCYSLESLPINVIDLKNITGTISAMFQSNMNMTRVPALINTGNVTDMSGLFAECSELEEVGEINTTKNTLFNLMFYNCINLKKLPSSFSGASGTNFSSMFLGCRRLKTLPYINTRNGQSFLDFIRDCYSLETVPAYDYTNATSFQRLFYQCANLKYVPDLNNGSAMTNMNNMFFSCAALVDVPGLTATNVTDITNAFNGCINLRTIPAYNFGKVTSSTTPFPTSGTLASFGATGISFSFSLSTNTLGSTALDSVYNSLVTVGASGAGVRTLTVSGNWGFTGSNRAIAIGKGWAIA